MFEEKLQEWVERVLKAYRAESTAHAYSNTYQMMIDIDQIISEGFDRQPLIEE